MEQKPKTPREQAADFIRLLVPDWRPAPQQVLWTIRIVIVSGVLIAIGYYYNVTLWDWLKLLIIPAVLAAGGLWFNVQQREREQLIAHERAQDATLQAYLEGMSQMLTDKERPLHRAQVGDSLSTVARARTLTVLGRLQDGERKRSILQFLYEAHLIRKERSVIDLEGANLREAPLGQINLQGVALTRANLEGVHLEQAHLEEARLEDATLTRANLRGTLFHNADLEGADLEGADLEGANLTAARLWQANLQGATLKKAGGFGTSFKGARLEEACLEEALLWHANLQGATLTRANLRGAYLKEAHLEKVTYNEIDLPDEAFDFDDEGNLEDAIREGANFIEGANLKGADLEGADLEGANLNGVNLREANLREAKVTREQLEQAESLEGATMPNGQKYEDWRKSKDRGEDG